MATFDHKKQFRIVQIGCGVVGRAYVSAYQNVGCHVIGIEANSKLIETYKDDLEMYNVCDDMSKMKDIDFVMLSICTPLKDDRLDLSYLFSSINNVAVIAKNNPDVCVIIRSTVPPTTTREYKNRLEQIISKPVKVLFQPEFLRAVSAIEDAMHPWHIVLGADNDVDISKLMNLYTKFVKKEQISIMSVENAELLKIFHNTYNANKISFTNQCDLLCKAVSAKHNISVNSETIMATMIKTCEGIINPKYGTKPGHAFYGICLPKDSAELASLERTYGLAVSFFDSIVKVNNEMKKMDQAEVLNGPHHVTFDKMKEKEHENH